VPLGVVPRLPFRSDDTVDCSTDCFRGVLMPDGVELPLTFRLVGAGLAVLEGVRGREIVLPNAEMPSFPVTLVIVDPVTDNRCGLCELPLGVVDPMRLCGMRVGFASSLLSSDNEEP